MPPDFKGFLPVKWEDGMRVDSAHLRHSDERVLSLLTEFGRQAIEDVGISALGMASARTNQLFDIAQKDDGAGSSPRIVVTPVRSFWAIAPSGAILLAIANVTPSFAVDVPTGGEPSGGGLLFISCEGERGVKAQRSEDAEVVELRAPLLKGRILKPREAIEQWDDLQESLPLAGIQQVAGNWSRDERFIPPVLRMRYIEEFNPGINSDLQQKLQQLLKRCWEEVTGGQETIGEVDATYTGQFVGRNMSFLILATLLMNRSGLISNLGGSSPFRLFHDLLVPLASWYDYYLENLIRRDPLRREKPVHQKLRESVRVVRQWTDSDTCMRLSDLLEEIDNLAVGLHAMI